MEHVILWKHKHFLPLQLQPHIYFAASLPYPSFPFHIQQYKQLQQDLQLVVHQHGFFPFSFFIGSLPTCNLQIHACIHPPLQHCIKQHINVNCPLNQEDHGIQLEEVLGSKMHLKCLPHQKMVNGPGQSSKVTTLVPLVLHGSACLFAVHRQLTLTKFEDGPSYTAG